MFRIIAIISIVTSLLLGAGLEANTSTSNHRLARVVSAASSDCKHMTIKRARKVFRHIDGSRTLRSEWTIKDEKTIAYESDLDAKGRIPRDQYAHFSGAYNLFEGAIARGSNFTVNCMVDPGTSHTKNPPSHCPETAREASQQIGGNDEDWWVADAGTAIELVYKEGQLSPLGSFTVPFQGLVGSRWGGDSIHFTPGYTVPLTEDNLGLYCFRIPIQ